MNDKTQNDVDQMLGLQKPAANPLLQYFRHEKIQIELPTHGKFWPEGAIELQEDGLLSVMPMTAKDEIMMKSPEGLLSGSAVVDTIESCIPGIKDAWVMPGHDVDAILIAIRLASYDHNLEVTSICSHCKESNQNIFDLRALLDSIPKGTIKNIFKVKDLTIEFKPYSFRFLNENNKAKFNQEKLARNIVNTDISESDRSEHFDTMFKELATHNLESIVVALEKIILPDGQSVTDKLQITEFVNNTDREMIKDIKDKIIEMNSAVSTKPMRVECEHCEKEYETSIEFNQANFFALGFYPLATKK